MDRGAWRAIVPRVIKSQTRLSGLAHMHKKLVSKVTSAPSSDSLTSLYLFFPFVR